MTGGAGNLDTLPGSADYVDLQELERQGHTDIHRILQQIPGVVIQEEEGYGLRPNIGMRGTGSERSSKITLLEDGVLIAPAPYAAPSAYYFPTAGRMEALEVRKGSSSIRQGPYTTGGVLNLISTSIPGRLGGKVDLAAGEDGLVRGHALAGDSTERFGWLAESYRMRAGGFKHLDGGGDTGFELEDYLVKLRWGSSAEAAVDQTLELKLGRTDQLGHETYLGLTQEDFERDPLRRYAASQEDLIDTGTSRCSCATSCSCAATSTSRPRSTATTSSATGTSSSRCAAGPWPTSSTPPPSSRASLPSCAATRTAPPATSGCATTGATTSPGASRMLIGLAAGARHQVEIGVRYHEDQEDRFQEEDLYRMAGGRMALDALGAPGSQSNRVDRAEAVAFFVQDEISFGRLTVTPGLRFESIDTVRRDFGKRDPERTGGDLAVRANRTEVWIPGLGVDYRLGSQASLFLGVHKGFSPPGPGTDDRTRPEESVNFEAGLRYRGTGAGGRVTAFFNDYDNLLGRDTLSAGGQGEGAVFNGGAVAVRGVEVAFDLDPGKRRSWGVRLPLRLSYTYTEAEFRSSFASDFGPWQPLVNAGDELPYLPEHQGWASAGVAGERWDAHLSLTYVGAMRARAGAGAIPEGEGTDAHLVFDLSAGWEPAV